MSCKYCEGTNAKKLLEKDFLDDLEVILDDKIPKGQADYDKYMVYVDRGYLRLIDENNNQCLGHGEKIKINYCPMCGVKL